jgi:lipopolysaccharide transport system ATP-binding protein
MSDSAAIRLSNVSKVYQLYGSQRDQLISVLGLERFGLRPRAQSSEFVALKEIDLTVPRGHRVAIIGRNGAGKTTLLKLICGNISPTKGTIHVNGTVQALMTTGTGFHPEHTGRENIIGSLQYNGLDRKDYQQAIEGIIEFCELGDFIDQPFKTYSLGMQARLMFATVTAVKPDILIVDEVLGAGDAYFVAKSRMRVEQLIHSGCTMLLVSHSMQQVMELCKEAIWLDQGRIRMQGPAFDVVKAYEEYVHGPIRSLEKSSDVGNGNNRSRSGALPSGDCRSGSDLIVPGSAKQKLKKKLQFQEPYFHPHGCQAMELIRSQERANSFSALAPGGLSRWNSEQGVKLVGFEIISDSPNLNTLVSLQPAILALRIAAEVSGQFALRYGIAIHDYLGRCATRIFSPKDEFNIEAGQTRLVEIHLNPNQLGPGEYTLGVSILEYSPIEALNSATRYDLLSRSFALTVEMPESISGVEAQFFHSAEWAFSCD